MQISEENLKEWTMLLDHGDIAKIAALLNLGTQQTATIVKTGKGKAHHIAKIAGYFNKRKRQLAGKIKDDNN
jgi:hypothetical protein